MTIRIKDSHTSTSQGRKARSAAAKSPSRTNCPSGPTRRSARLRQRSSPYFEVKKESKKRSFALPTLKRSTSEARGDPLLKAPRNLKADMDPRRNKAKLSKSAGKVKSDSEAESDPATESERVHGLARRANFYGLIQEVVTPNVFRLLVATCLLNQTKGRAAMPVFWELLRRWPDEHSLAEADLVELTDLLQPIGLHNIRARRLISMAKTMVEIPYDESNSFKSRDRTAPDTPIGIYPGVGRYAIDSWRIFVAGGGASVGLGGEKPVSPFDVASTVAALPADDQKVTLQSASLGSSTSTSLNASIEPEWKSVLPLDKELRAYLIWRWEKEGHVWDPLRGVVSATSDPQ